MTGKSRQQVDKEIHIRRLGGKVKDTPAQRSVKSLKPGKLPSLRTAAQVDKDAHIRVMGGKVAPRGRLSDAATGRLKGTKFSPTLHPRDRKGRFKDK